MNDEQIKQLAEIIQEIAEEDLLDDRREYDQEDLRVAYEIGPEMVAVLELLIRVEIERER